MEQAKIEEAIRQAIAQCADENGWANLAELGAHLRKSEIKYGKLSKFFASYEHLVETRIDQDIAPPVVYARLKQVKTI